VFKIKHTSPPPSGGNSCLKNRSVWIAEPRYNFPNEIFQKNLVETKFYKNAKKKFLAKNGIRQAIDEYK
jgi:hypothetical protein